MIAVCFIPWISYLESQKQNLVDASSLFVVRITTGTGGIGTSVMIVARNGRGFDCIPSSSTMAMGALSLSLVCIVW